MSDKNIDIITGLLTAIKSEHDGQFFYSMAAKMTSDPKGRRVFEQLAKEEVKHLDFLRAQYETLKNRGTIDPAATLGKPVELDRHSPIFSDEITLKISDAHYEMSALSVGMQLEKSSMDHYQSLANKAVDPAVKSFLLELVEWERSHFSALETQYNRLKDPYWAKQLQLTP